MSRESIRHFEISELGKTTRAKKKKEKKMWVWPSQHSCRVLLLQPTERSVRGGAAGQLSPTSLCLSEAARGAALPVAAFVLTTSPTPTHAPLRSLRLDNSGEPARCAKGRAGERRGGG